MNPPRQKLLARIHILRKELALSSEEYRKIITEHFLRESASLLSEDELRQFTDILQNMKKSRYTLFNGNRSKSSKKIWAAWYELRGYLKSSKKSTSYLYGIAKRNAPTLCMNNGVLDFDLVNPVEADGIIRSLINALNYEKNKLAQEVPF